MFDPGHILVDLCTRRDERLTVTVCNTRSARVAEELVKPATRANARRLIGLVYGLCPLAHLNAFDAARAAALGRTVGELRARTLAFGESALMLEALTENLRVLTLEVQNLLPAGPRVTDNIGNAKRFGALRGRVQTLVHVASAMDPLAGLDDNPTTDDAKKRACAWAQAAEVVDQMLPDLTTAFRDMLFGMTPEAWLTEAATSEDALLGWAEAHRDTLPAAHWIAHLAKRPAGWGAIGCERLPASAKILDELGSRMLSETGFALAPRLSHRPRLTGAYARMEHAAIFRPFSRRGPDAMSLAAARLFECALGLRLLEGDHAARARRFTTLEAAGTPLVAAAPTTEGAVGCAESARGLLAHAVTLDEDRLPEHLAITSPTEWQFAPEGPAARVASELVRRLCGESKTECCRELLSQNSLEQQLKEALFGLDACVPVVFQHRANGGPLHA